MDFTTAEKVEEVVWQMRQADLPRGSNRTILQRTYNGDPPFDESEAEANNVQINRNDLEGVNALSQARRQWNNAFLKPGNFFTVTVDSGPAHKRAEWSHIITQELNRQLKRQRGMIEQLRAKGAMAILHGVGAINWPDRTKPIATPIPMSSLMIPSETDIDFENLTYFAVFREWTPAQFYRMIRGPRVDPGWNMKMAVSQWSYLKDELQKGPNATAFQYMPERIEELIKQDLGFWGTDAVPTIDVWDFYYRPDDDGKGWYRKIILDWTLGESGSDNAKFVASDRNKLTEGSEKKSTFLYDSGKRVYAKHLSEILHCQFADCSAVAPFKYHSVRSLGWMLWGIADLQNRLHCKFNEAVFQNLLWFFRVASNDQLTRVRTANFAHMGVVPNNVEFIKAQDRYTPDMGLIAAAFSRNRQLISENAASFTQDFDKGQTDKEMTATETMARVNAVNALVSGMLSLAYTYEEFNYREICRRFCLPRNSYPAVAKFRLAVLKRGVPEEILDADRWDVSAERVLGGGNKTLEMAQVQFLQNLRKQLNPEAQRRVDHISIEAATDDPALAEDLAPVAQEERVSNSVLDAQFATERILRGLPFKLPEDAVYSEYAQTWLADLAAITQQLAQPMMGLNLEKIAGAFALAQALESLLSVMAQNDDEKETVKELEVALKKILAQLNLLAQKVRQQQKQPAGGGNGEAASKAAAEQAKIQAKLQGDVILAQAKAQNLRESHAQRTAQRQVQFELEQQRKDRESAAQMRRDALKQSQEMFGETESPDA